MSKELIEENARKEAEEKAKQKGDDDATKRVEQMREDKQQPRPPRQ